jgi:hypothetical protein
MPANHATDRPCIKIENRGACLLVTLCLLQHVGVTAAMVSPLDVSLDLAVEATVLPPPEPAVVDTDAAAAPPGMVADLSVSGSAADAEPLESLSLAVSSNAAVVFSDPTRATLTMAAVYDVNGLCTGRTCAVGEFDTTFVYRFEIDAGGTLNVDYVASYDLGVTDFFFDTAFTVGVDPGTTHAIPKTSLGSESDTVTGTFLFDVAPQTPTTLEIRLFRATGVINLAGVDIWDGIFEITVEPHVVPVPPAAALLAPCVVALGMFRRRRPGSCG